MHVVIWKSENGHYATPSRQVVEVIPVVQSAPLPHSQPWIRGAFNYRGRLIALVDVTMLLYGHSPNRQQFARILVVETKSIRGADGDCIGLLVDAVLGSEQLDFDGAQTLESVDARDELGFLGPIGLFESQTIQLTDPERIAVPQVKLDQR